MQASRDPWPNAFATQWVTDPRDPSPNPQQPLFKIIIGGLPDGASVTVEHTNTSAGVNDKDLDPFYVPVELSPSTTCGLAQFKRALQP
jgi:hypothetical protein